MRGFLFSVCICSLILMPEKSDATDKELGEDCNESSECSVIGALCMLSTCTCNESRYDSNGLEQRGACQPVTHLQVKDVSFIAQTNQIIVSWLPPVNYEQYIDGYTVKWQRKYGYNIEEESENVVSSTSTLILERAIDPGRAYNITIISRNERTQQGSVRRTSITRMQAAKPSITTGLDLANSELDPSDGKITVAWFEAPGYVQGYRVQLFDGSTSLSRSHPSSTYNTFFLSGLKPGYIYEIAIQAKSEQYYERMILYGDIYTATFSTTVTVPGPPREGDCICSSETSITLLWIPPSEPNGKLTRYSVHVYRASNLEFISNTPGNVTIHTVDGLYQGTEYSFRVYAENEKYNSTRYDAIDSSCKTNGKLSDPSTDLKITDVSSRDFTVTWNEPVNIYDEYIRGYVINIKINHVCVAEVIYTCQTCHAEFEGTIRENVCQSTVTYIPPDSYENLTGVQVYQVSRLIPDTVYTVTVSAVNSLGRGVAVIVKQKTSNDTNDTNDTKELSSEEERNCKEHFIIIGALAAVLTFISVYAGYATLLIRRLKTKKERRIMNERNEVRGNIQNGPIYMNESVITGSTGREGRPNVHHVSASDSDTGYVKMDDSTRDFRPTYDVLQNHIH